MTSGIDKGRKGTWRGRPRQMVMDCSQLVQRLESGRWRETLTWLGKFNWRCLPLQRGLCVWVIKANIFRVLHMLVTVLNSLYGFFFNYLHFCFADVETDTSTGYEVSTREDPSDIGSSQYKVWAGWQLFWVVRIQVQSQAFLRVSF